MAGPAEGPAQEPQDVEGGNVPPQGPRPLDRRRLLAAAASFIATGTTSLFSKHLAAADTLDLPRSMRVPGSPPRSYGGRSRFETVTRSVSGAISLTPLQDLYGVVTPSSLHFERHHNGVPAIDPARHRLLVHGLVERPMVFTVEDLKRLPSVSRLAFIECSGNSRQGWGEAQDVTVQTLHGLTSTSEWTGVKLSTVLEIVGLRQEAAWMLAEGADAAGLDRSVPLTTEVLRDALICYGQNGEALRPEQGYPVRLLLPGFEGNINVKWLRRLKVGAAPFMTRWETSTYTDLMPDGKAYQFSLVMEAKSVITSPSGRQRIVPGFHEIRGLAWSGRGRIVSVEVSLDGGRRWLAAELQEPVLAKCHTGFRLPWRWDGEEAVLQSRCRDETGYLQPIRTALVHVRGTQSLYHYNGIQSWKVGRDGVVTNVAR
ncbi:MAG TPA: sulfite dehydrogenase [Nitrospira sp.]|nr:sulfite dehydrogenase [Nitrospira sp.]